MAKIKEQQTLKLLEIIFTNPNHISQELPEVDKAQAAELISSIFRERSKIKLTLNFDGEGNCIPELHLSGEATIKHYLKQL